MIFDEDDFATMTPEDKLIVIMHEMGHVLGIGTLWSNFKCGTECQDGSVEYSCTEARDEYEHYPYKTGTLAIEKTVCAHWTGKVLDTHVDIYALKHYHTFNYSIRCDFRGKFFS